jgi:DNA polymerase-3 subunit epsilon/CBS domain-containing protein
MAKAGNAAPLIGIDAVVIDTETTGLDPAKARIVEVAGVRIAGGVLGSAASFRRLVKPDQPIPKASTAIHRIDDAVVADASPFREVWPELSDYIGQTLVVGHSLGFDLAVLKHECRRAGLPWHRPRSLCTALLAQAAAPNLAGYSLDQLAAWLGVEVTSRHSALADATVTAKVFLALIPKLRAVGIRTLAEAEQASRARGRTLTDQHRAGWEEAVSAPSRADLERALQRIDAYPYRHRVADVMSAPPRIIAPDTVLRSALAIMSAERVSSLLVAAAIGSEGARADETGIVTERDVLRAIAQDGAAVFEKPVVTLANRPLMTVPAGAFIYRAIGRMSRLNIRHLGVVDESGVVCGVLSARDLLRLRAEEAVALGDELELADDVPALARAWAKMPDVAAGLLAEGVTGRDAAAVISRELGALTRRAAVLAERGLAAQRQGGPPCRYAFLVLGSAGRGESLLAPDQDNAIVFAEGEPDGDADRWFAQLGAIVADILNDVGVPYCDGGVMGRNPQWRGSLATWRQRISDWMRRTRPEDLLAVDIFFDLRAVHGDATLANKIWHAGFEAARGDAGFAKLLAECAAPLGQGLTFFGGIRTEDGRIDLKRAGLFNVVSTARLLAVCHHVVERSTPARLAGLAAAGLGHADELTRLADAQAVFLELILAQQIVDMEAGLRPSNKVAVKRLAAADRDRLRAVLKDVRHVEEFTRALLFRHKATA